MSLYVREFSATSVTCYFDLSTRVDSAFNVYTNVRIIVTVSAVSILVFTYNVDERMRCQLNCYQHMHW